MAENFKIGSKLFLKMIVVAIMSFIVVISMDVILIGAFTKEAGYDAWGTTSESTESEKLYTHYYEDGDDTKKAEYEEKGYTLSFMKFRSQPTKAQKNLFLIITQIICLTLTYAFVYPQFWDMGAKDNNLANFGHIERDKLRGLKCGLIAIAPIFVFYVVITVLKFTGVPFPAVFLKLLSSPVYCIAELLIGKAVSVADLTVIKIIALFALSFIIPLFASLGYTLGQHDFSFADKFIYKKNKEKVRK